MAKILLAAVVLVVAYLPLSARQQSMIIPGGATLPATCQVLLNGGQVFFKTSAVVGLYSCVATNTWSLPSGGGGGGDGAPLDGSYWVRVTNTELTNETIMGSLGTGFVINTTTTGVPTVFAGSTCAPQFATAISASGVLTCATPSGAGDVLASGTLTANQLLIGGGTTFVSALGSLGTTTTVLHGNAGGAPSFSAIVGADITTGTIALTKLATQVDQTIVANLSGGTASPSAVTAEALATALGIIDVPDVVQGDVVYASGANTFAILSKSVVAGQAICNSGTNNNPAWCTPASPLTEAEWATLREMIQAWRTQR